MKPFFYFFILYFFAFKSFAGLVIPSQMTAQDRHTALEILGLGSATKVLGNPYPLGGYSGVELGFANEVLPTSDIARMGSKASPQSETSYTLLTFGKGIYNNIDVFLQFAPTNQNEDISNFGGQIRWGFFQAEYWPLHLSLIVHGNSTNYQNLITTSTQGMDMVAGFTVEDITVFCGGGTIRAQGTFMGNGGGGPGTGAGVTDSGATEQASLTAAHILGGLNIRFSKMFLALEMDRYTQATYAAKLGLRF